MKRAGKRRPPSRRFPRVKSSPSGSATRTGPRSPRSWPCSTASAQPGIRVARPLEDSLCLVLPVGEDVTTRAVAAGLDPVHSVGLDPLFLTGCRTVMTTPVTAARHRDAAHALFAADGTPVGVVRDSPGFVAQRVIATIVNIGCDIAQQGIATPQDIDHAVTLGLGYPLGPLALGDRLGAATVLRILDGLFAFYRDPRYRPSPWLKRRAMLGVSLLTPEN